MRIRTFLTFSVLALLALPALAAPAPPAAALAPLPGGSACGQELGTFDLAPLSTAAGPEVPAWLDPQPAQTTVYHHFCACTCSRIPDCNTNADCSNHRCLSGISCC